jgi:DNA-binding transcriptional ArsR family regulator
MKDTMRPLFHPAIEDVSPEAILHALSDPNRAAILVNILEEGGIKACASVSKLGTRAIPKSSLSNHFKILREAGLIRSERHGVEMRNYLRLAEVNGRFPGLLSAIMDAYGSKVDDGTSESH